MLKRKNIRFNSMNYSKKYFRTISIISLAIFVLSFYVIPSAYSITVAEQARKAEKKDTPAIYDEFSKKTQERRDFDRFQQKRDPRLACLLSLMTPGAGHIYLRQDLKGIAILGTSLIGYSSAGYYLYASMDSGSSSGEGKSKIIISGLLFLVAFIIHVVGIVEAYNDAIEINEEEFYFGEADSKHPYIAKVIIE